MAAAKTYNGDLANLPPALLPLTRRMQVMIVTTANLMIAPPSGV
jgi:hypothetical protein